MIADDELEELRTICPGATPATDGPLELVILPKLIVESDKTLVEVDQGLLCLSEHQGYSTRLFLSQSFPNKRPNWSLYTILGRTWYSWSWQGIPRNHSAAQILSQHLKALR